MSNVRWARIGFALLAWLFVAMAVVQIYLAGTAIEQLGGSKDFTTHQLFGYGIMIIALVQLVLSFAGRLGWRMVGASAVLLGLMVLQSALVHLNTPSLAAFHPVNGFLVSLVAIWVAWRSLGHVRAPLPPEPVHQVAAPAPAGPQPQAPDPAADDQA